MVPGSVTCQRKICQIFAFFVTLLQKCFWAKMTKWSLLHIDKKCLLLFKTLVHFTQCASLSDKIWIIFSCPKRNSLLREADQCESYWKYFLDIFQLFAIWFFAFIRTLNPSHFRSQQSNSRRLKVQNVTFIGKCLHFRYFGEVSLKTSGNTGPTDLSVSFVILR